MPKRTYKSNTAMENYVYFFDCPIEISMNVGIAIINHHPNQQKWLV